MLTLGIAMLKRWTRRTDMVLPMLPAAAICYPHYQFSAATRQFCNGHGGRNQQDRGLFKRSN
jgi:hypothetical protein